RMGEHGNIPCFGQVYNIATMVEVSMRQNDGSRCITFAKTSLSYVHNLFCALRHSRIYKYPIAPTRLANHYHIDNLIGVIEHVRGNFLTGLARNGCHRYPPVVVTLSHFGHRIPIFRSHLGPLAIEHLSIRLVQRLAEYCIFPDITGISRKSRRVNRDETGSPVLRRILPPERSLHAYLFFNSGT